MCQDSTDFSYLFIAKICLSTTVCWLNKDENIAQQIYQPIGLTEICLNSAILTVE